MKFRNASIKAAIVLIPSYIAAFLTEQMVYVVPMLAASSFFAGTVELGASTTRRRIDEEEAVDSEADDINEVDDFGSVAEVLEATEVE
ncbi:hypothetical protein [Pararhodobacter oceanensis]|uniref:hypothetical protein n=1 Tax=Pararhodobacter oceanensis TaxID=2172121 RepID=UPI003A94EB64